MWECIACVRRRLCKMLQLRSQRMLDLRYILHILKDLSSDTLSVLFVKYKQVLFGRALCLVLAVLVFYLWSQIRSFDGIFIVFYIGLFGISASMKKPFSFVHIASLPLFFTPYIILPVMINQTGLFLVLTGIFFAIFFYYKNNKRLNALVQIALCAPTAIFIILRLFVN